MKGKPLAHKRFEGAPAVRFWAKVQKAGPDECWLWLAGVTKSGPHGYGRFMVDSRRVVVAHRFAWELANGPVPAGLIVCHRCDVPRCVNPSHLFVGTQSDNMQDASRKGRSAWQVHEAPRGDACSTTRIPDSLCLCMRMDYAFGGMTQREIAESYGIKHGTAEGIISGRNRKGLPTVEELRSEETP